MEISWSGNSWSSIFYLAWRMRFSRSGQPAHSPLMQAIEPHASEVHAELGRVVGRVPEAWRLLPILAVRHADAQGLAERVVTRLEGRAAATPSVCKRLGGVMRELATAAQQTAPNWDEQLSLRIRPIRDTWLTIGPGLLRQMARLTDEELFAARAELVVVEPFQGGGEPFLDENTVLWEGVLANPHPLPETLRLGWLLSQLNNDIARYSERVPPGRLPAIAKLAMIPPTLAAAAELGVAADDPSTRNDAIELWFPDADQLGEPAFVAATLSAWWETLDHTQVSWDIALAGLDQLLQTEAT